MNIIISSNVAKPIYAQISAQIKTMVMSGELQAGDGLPSMRELAKTLHISVITVQKAYEDLQRDGFIETTVGRGSFVSDHNREFYKNEQKRRVEEYLLAAAETGRMSNISLSELTELLTLYYRQGERRIPMRELILKKENANGKDTVVIADAVSGDIEYTLEKTKESMLSESFAVRSKSGEAAAEIKKEHVLFTPAKLPKLTVSMKDGRSFTVKKEIEQLVDEIHVEGAGLTVRGVIFSEQFDLLCEDKRIAGFTCRDRQLSFQVNESEELTAALFALAIQLAK